MMIVAERTNLPRVVLRKMQKAQLRAADLSVAQVLRDLKATLNAESRVERLLALSREQRDILSWTWPYAEDTELPLAPPAARALGNDIADEIQRRRAPMIREAHAVVGRTFIAIAERAYVAYQWIVDSMDQAMVDALGRVREHRTLVEQEGEALPFPDHARLTGLYVPATNEQTMRWVNARAPWDGKALLNRFEDLEDFDRGVLRAQLVQGLREGQGMAKIARNVRKGVGMVQHRATTIARTEIMRASHEAKEETFAMFRKDGTIGGVGITAALDDRVCELCMYYDGMEYFYHKDPPISDMPMLPLHPNCRCASVPISALWDKLGVPKGERWTGYRAGRGVKVPVDTDFNGWLRRMEKAHPGYGGKLFTSKGRYAAWMQGQDVRAVIRSDPGIWKRMEAVPKYGSARTRSRRRRKGQSGAEPAK